MFEKHFDVFQCEFRYGHLWEEGVAATIWVHFTVHTVFATGEDNLVDTTSKAMQFQSHAGEILENENIQVTLW